MRLRSLAWVVALSLAAAGCGSSPTDPPSAASSTLATDSHSTGSVPTSFPPTDSLPTSTSDMPADPQLTQPWPTDPADLEGVAKWTIEVVDRIPHDPESYTQGLEVVGDVLYESGGLYGESSIRMIDVNTGALIDRSALDPALFGEGLTVVGDELVQITWREGRALRWDRLTLEPLGEWQYQGEGWGICRRGDRLIMSDGTDELTWRDPTDFSETAAVSITLGGDPIDFVNELECVGDLVIANVYLTTDLLVIDPVTGIVVAVVDASPLLDLVAGRIGTDRGNVLNGIADMGDGTLLLGGKRWPEMFKVRLVEP